MTIFDITLLVTLVVITLVVSALSSKDKKKDKTHYNEIKLNTALFCEDD